MADYTSPGLELAVVWDAENWEQLAAVYSGDGVGAGYEERDWDECPFGYAANEFNLPLIPEDEIDERIKEQDEKGLTLDHFAKKVGMNSPSQGSTNSCWAYAGTQAMRYAIARQTGVLVDLCPTSTVCRLTNYQNIGGWSSRFVEGVAQFGINTVAEWPRNAFSRKYNTEENKAKSLLRRAVEFQDLPVRGLSAKKRGQILATALLNNRPVASGHNWMRHAVMMKRLGFKNGKRVVVADNSGLYRDRNGETVFSWEKAIYDDAVMCSVVRLVAGDLQ